MTKIRFFLILGAIAATSSCGDEPAAPAASPAKAAKAASKPKPVPVAMAAPSDGGIVSEAIQYTYNYNPVGKRDPFRSPVEEAKKGDEPGESVCPEPLCQFDLEQLALVAVVSGDANPVAMLEDSNKVGHIVRRNTKVGKQGGKVSQILRDCIEVTEFFLSPDHKKIPNRVSICVKKEEKVERAYDLFNNKATE